MRSTPKLQFGNMSPGICLHLSKTDREWSASAKNASLWLTAFPVAPEMVMADELYLLAVKHRLGLRPMEDLPQKCSCGAVLGDDPQHFFSCRLLKRKAMTQRHDSIVRL